MADVHTPGDALLTEHLRYTPLSLIDDIINTVNAIVYRALGAIESGLLNTPPAALGYTSVPFQQSASSTSSSKSATNGHAASTINGASADGDESSDPSELARAEIENGVHQLETLLEATVDKTFDKFEIYVLRNILTVPEGLEAWVRLGHYEDLALPRDANAPTPQSLQWLRQKLRASQTVNIALEREAAQTDTLLQQLRTALTPTTTTTTPSTLADIKLDPTSPNATATTPATPSPLSLLTSRNPTSASSSAPLTTSAQFATSQLPALRSLVAQLRGKVRHLRDTDQLMERKTGDVGRGGSAETDSDRKARRGYVEGVARRVVGDTLGRTAGESEAGTGARVGEDEVLAMEGIVEGNGTQ